MNARSRNFILANEVSPVVYGSVDGNCITYRLQDGKMFHLNAEEARAAPNPRWAFVEAEMNAVAIKHQRRENGDMLRKVEAEANDHGGRER